MNFNESGYTPLEMVERAVKNATPRDIYDCPRWVAVREIFGYGSTTSAQLCRHFGLDPHELLKSNHTHEE